MEPANGKIGEKGCIITVWWRRNSRIMTGPNTSCIPFGKPKSRFSYMGKAAAGCDGDIYLKALSEYMVVFVSSIY